jgi:hypothetical protein
MNGTLHYPAAILATYGSAPQSVEDSITDIIEHWRHIVTAKQATVGPATFVSFWQNKK